MISRKAVIVFVCLLFSAPAFSETVEAPFGFAWGQNQGDVGGGGVRLSGCKKGKKKGGVAFTRCKTEQVPRPGELSGEYELEFFPGKGLLSVRAKYLILNKFSGTSGRDFSDLALSLRRQYGEPVREKEGKEIAWEGEEGGIVHLFMRASRSSSTIHLRYISAGLLQLYSEQRARKSAQ